MRFIMIALCASLIGCASTADYAAYIEAHKSTSKDATIAEVACYNVIAEGIKAGDNTMKTVAVALMGQCKKQAEKIEPPKSLIAF